MSANSSARRCSALSKVLGEHGVEVDLAPDLPLVMVDAVLFEQVLFNLLDNAAKYSPASTKIRVLGWQRGAPTSACRSSMKAKAFRVSEQEKIFDKFYRAQKGDYVRPGTGLGLAIARGFVEAMGGRLTASNRNDRSGAVFTLAIPAAPAQKSTLEDVA